MNGNLAFDSLLITGGEVSRDFALCFLSAYPHVRLFAADQGLEACRELSLFPEVVLGDFDSAREETVSWARGAGIEVCSLPSHKDDSDTQAALREAKRRGAKTVAILGATGTRLDHVLANLGLLLWGKKEGLCLHLYDPYNHIYLAESGMAIRREDAFGENVSFFSLGGEVEGLCLSGFVYPLENHRLSFSEASLTVSNVLSGEEGKVFFTAGDLFVAETRDEPYTDPGKGK